MFGVSAASQPVARARGLLIGLQIALLVFSLAAPAGTVFAATIQTDLWVYADGDTVTVIGADFAPNEPVDIVTTDPGGNAVDHGTVESDEVGSFRYEFVLGLTAGGLYDVVGTGATSGLTATTQFDPAFATLSLTSITFGSVAVGSSAGPTTVTITNTGTTNLNVQTIAVSPATQFSLTTPSLPANAIAPGSSISFSVSFMPTSAGAKTATVSVGTNANTATVSLSGTGTAADQPPTAVNDSATVGEDSGATTIAVLANDTDTDGGPKTVTAVGSAAHGTTAITGGGTGVSYTPAANFCGGDAFTYTLNGGSSATVTVTVTCVDDVPVAVDDSATVGEDSTANAIDVLANDTDLDGGPKSIASVTQGAHGSVAITGGGSSVGYTPVANICGADAFTYTLNGGSSATVTVTVSCVDDAPTAVDDTTTVSEDSGANAIDVLANDTDLDGGPKSVASVGSAALGTTAISGGGTAVSYAPAANSCGEDAFTYTLNGGSSATVTVTVSCVADAPVATDDGATTAEDTGVDVDVLANDTDADGDALHVDTFDAVSAEGGIVVLNADGTLHYVPAANFFGADSFTYTAGDGGLGSNVATVTVTVTPVNDPPTANGDAATVDEDEAVDVDVLGNDSDVDNTAGDLSVSSFTQGAHGSVAQNGDGSLRYTPAANFNGTDTFTYRISDGDLISAPATVTITVNPVNDAPVLDPIGVQSVDEETLLAFTATAADVDGDPLTFSLGVGAPAGAAISTAGAFTWTSTEAQGPGTFTFDVIVDDGDLHDAETITVTVREVNRPPVLDSVGGQTIEEGSELTFTATASDADLPANHLTFSLVGAPAGATIDPDSGAFSWTPTDNAVVTFAVVVTDDGSPALADTEVISVTVANAPPTVDSLAISGGTGTSCLGGNAVGVSFTFHDPGLLDATWVADIDWGDGSPHGVVSLSGQTGTFGPYPHSYGVGAFTPVVTVVDKDGSSGSRSAVTGVAHLFATSGFLQPINIAGQRSSFKIGSTIPVKLQVTDCAGTAVPGQVLTVHLQRTDGSADVVNEVVSSSGADTGSQMRYDSSGRQYIFNLSTKNSQFSAGQDLVTGTYHLWVTGTFITQVDASFDARK